MRTASPLARHARPSSTARLGVVATAGAAVCAVALAACASGGGGGKGPIANPAVGAQVTTRISGGADGAMELRTVATENAGVEVTLPAAADRVFAELPAVYEALQLPVNTIMSEARMLGARDVRAPRRVARQALSRYLNCGADPAGMSHADTWAVTLTTVSRVTPGSDAASTLTTQVSATARPVSTSGSTVTCASSGKLEQTINEALLARVRQQP